ncbi:hypothetical protein N9522_00680 [Candidatus Thioglobus sp.]|nr:hypothetical protein [Candidatus Thioglobus sp.]
MTIGGMSLNSTNELNFLERNPKKSLLIIIVVITLLIEMIGHVAYYFVKEENFLKSRSVKLSEFTPYGMVRYKENVVIPLKGYPSSLNTDEYGAISSEGILNKSAYLIVMLGGSTLEGRGASSNDKTISSILEGLLNKDPRINSQIKVLNFGNPGMDTYQELSALSGYVSQDFSPDLIISFDGRNDAYYGISFNEWKMNSQPYYEKISRTINQNLDNNLSVLINNLKKHSIIVTSIDKIIHRINEPFKHNVDTKLINNNRVDKVIESYINNHEIMKYRSEQIDAKYYAFFQPTLTKDNVESFAQSKIINDWRKTYNDKNIYYDKLDIFYKAVQSKIEKLEWFTDMSFILNNETDIYFDSCHYNDKGNGIISNFIYNKIKNDIYNDIKLIERENNNKSLPT